MAAIVVPTVLNRKNYVDWSSRIKSYLLAEDLWDVVEGSYRPPVREGECDNEAWKKKNVKALYAIQSSCGDDTYQLVKTETKAKQAWDTLSFLLKPDENPPDEHAKMSLRQAHPFLTLTDRDARPELTMEEGRTEGGAGHDDSNANDIHETFVKYVKSNDWDNAIEFLGKHPEERSARILYGRTALHCAIWNFRSCSVRVIEQLVDLMTKDDLKIQDTDGFTALYTLIYFYPEMVEVAKRMVAKNEELITILPSHLERPLVVVVAQEMTKGERMARYLYSLTPDEILKVPDAAQLISLGFYYNRLDIAWDLIQRYPKLAMTKDSKGDIPLVTLASNRFAFKSGSRLSLWEKIIYYVIHIKRLPFVNKDNHINIEKQESDQSDQGHLSDQRMGLFRGLLTNLQTLLGINHIYQMKLMHERVKQFLPFMCKAVKAQGMSYYKRKKLNEALCVAAERGHVEYITHFFIDSSYPVDDVKNEKGQTLLQIATECRHHKVYNFIYDQLLKKENILGLDPSDEIRERVGWRDYFGNNLLHTIASITPLSQIDHIQGAALQMQRELQWFKEVESIVDPKDCESLNKDNKTPRKVFTENHKELGREAEKSMKETSTSCTVVGALIVTIMFAAAFTVPGGNDEKTGLPTFLTKKVFTTFIVSDAISLFSSTTSVIMFLGILTSRYSEDDFHKFLPTKMIAGLFTLFLSIVTMMIVFSCALYIMLDGKSSIVVPSMLLASVPVTSFIWMQFPLLVELFISTFGRGIFDRNHKTLF
ncbi:hypothetical protein D8674_037461 [Pyrus ussuriensis x Pyrus communis]|uniref:PGG domain-containing protein n=1 Tax=Pyrus ussuriensis x Pyrus communis TaxID=2448454 RepID=A0A5N5GWA5_9ROSA|nr:hypothetical protein D8674_037461 [Pyrus ussuriensis x Pyrus communis]